MNASGALRAITGIASQSAIVAGIDGRLALAVAERGRMYKKGSARVGKGPRPQSTPANAIDLTAYLRETPRQDCELALYRGRHPAPRAEPSVLFLAPVSRRHSPGTIERLTHEWGLAQELDPAWAVQPLALAHEDGRAILGVDDPGGEPIPEKFYGPMREVETLLASFDRVVRTGTPELVLVSGYSDIGKSSVVHELHRALVPPRGLFAAGKFDRYKRDIPHATLAQAVQRLVRPLLGKSNAELARWTTRSGRTRGSSRTRNDFRRTCKHSRSGMGREATSACALSFAASYSASARPPGCPSRAAARASPAVWRQRQPVCEAYWPRPRASSAIPSWRQPSRHRHAAHGHATRRP